jgi:hypothetical protein
VAWRTEAYSTAASRSNIAISLSILQPEAFIRQPEAAAPDADALQIRLVEKGELGLAGAAALPEAACTKPAQQAWKRMGGGSVVSDRSP